MAKPFLSWGIIVRDDAKNLEACLKSLRRETPKAEIIVVDTGSNDDSVEVAKRYQAKVDHFEWCDDFSAARNRTLELATGEVYGWIDSDDTLENASWAREFKDAAAAIYEYEVRQEKVVQRQIKDRFFKDPSRWIWQGALHEVLVLKSGASHESIRLPESFRFIHHKVFDQRTQRATLERNWRILTKQHRLGRATARDYCYLLKMAEFVDPSEALGLINWALEACGDRLERYRVQIAAGQWYASQGLVLEADGAFLEAIGLFPDLADAFLLAGDVYFQAARWYDAAKMYLEGLNKPDAGMRSVIDEPTRERCRKNTACACFEAGNVALLQRDYESAYSFFAKASVIDEKYRANTQAVKAFGDWKSFVVSMRLPDEVVAQQLADAPKAFHPIPAYWEMCRDYLPHAGEKLKATFVVDAALRPWDGKTIAQSGSGASETCLVQLAEGFDRYTEIYCPISATVTRGDATYHPTARRPFLDTRAPIVVSREPGVADKLVEETKSEKLDLILWMQDVKSVKPFERYRKIVCVSNWHKQWTAENDGVPLEKIAVIPNFLMRENFRERPARDRHRFIYASSPDRGLITLLEIWPKIREVYPDAVLDTFYGWGAFTSLSGGRSQEGGDWVRRHRKMRRRFLEIGNQPGVTHHGMVPQKELNHWMMRSSAWLYPSDYLETDCNTAREMLAAGCVPVCTPVAGLLESAKSEITQYVELGLDSEDYIERFVIATAHAVAMPEDARAKVAAETMETQALENRLPLWHALLDQR